MLVLFASIPFALDETLERDGRDRPTCFPLGSAIRYEVETGRLAGTAVMVEERSWCGGEGGAMRRAPPLPGPEVVGVDRLRAIVASAPAPPRGVRYEVVPRADGWLVAPVGAGRVVDTHVDVDPTRCGTVYGAEVCMRRDLLDGSGVSFAAGGSGVAINGAQPNSVSRVDTPFAEAWRAVQVPHERSPIGFVIEVHEDTSPTPPGPQGLLQALVCSFCD